MNAAAKRLYTGRVWISAEELLMALSARTQRVAPAEGEPPAGADLDLARSLETVDASWSAPGEPLSPREQGRVEGLQEAIELVTRLMRHERRARALQRQSMASRRSSSRPPSSPSREPRASRTTERPE